jgi:hypothetical protein
MRGVHGLLDAPPQGALGRDRASGVPLARLTRAVSAAQVLSGELWEALSERLERASAGDDVDGLSNVSAERVSEVSERLADVAATVGLLARRRLAPATSDGRLDEPSHSTVEPPVILVEPRDRPVEPQQTPAEQPVSPVERPAFEIEEEDRADGVHPALESALAQLGSDRLPCAVMLVELTAAQRDGGGPAGTAQSTPSGQIEDAFVRTLQDIAVGLDGQLIRERAGRCLLLLPETDRLRAQKLIGRLAGVARDVDAAVDGNDRAERYFAALSARTSARHAARPTPSLELAVGLAVCPQDGREASALLAHALQDLSFRMHAVSVQAGTVT